MRDKQRVALLYGGKSGEHEVSLRSACSVYRHIDIERFSPLLIGISKEGRWYLQDAFREAAPDILAIEERDENIVSARPGEGLFCGERKIEVDIVFPVLHGSFGEDGTVQGLLELIDLPYVGAGVLGSSLSMDKGRAKELWGERGLPIVPYWELHKSAYQTGSPEAARALEKIKSEYGLPLFVKPLRAGSSVGVSRVDQWSALDEALKEAFRYDTSLLIEPAIDGREIECSVVGNHKPMSFPPGEILPTHGFYDYEAKYVDPDGAVLQLPADIPAKTAAELRRIAIDAYRAVDAQGMARIDFFLERTSGRILLNEINTIPGFTSISMFPRMCEQGGLSYAALISRLLDLGWERYRERRACLYSVLLKTEAEG